MNILTNFGQISEVRPLPAQLLQHTAVKLLLLLTAVEQLSQVRIIQAGPVLCEGLCTVSLYLPVDQTICDSKKCK